MPNTNKRYSSFLAALMPVLLTPQQNKHMPTPKNTFYSLNNSRKNSRDYDFRKKKRKRKIAQESRRRNRI